jgi:hypothetical protein
MLENIDRGFEKGMIHESCALKGNVRWSMSQ